VSVDPTGLPSGTKTSSGTFTAADGSTKQVTVSLSVTSPSSGLVAAYGFEEASGTGVSDASGTGNIGTTNGPTRITTGRFGRALSFDGINDWVTIPDASSLDLTNRMTLEAWVYPIALGTPWRTVLLKEQPGNLVYALYAGDGTPRPSGEVFVGSNLDTHGTTAPALNAWTHLAVTYDGAALRLLVNGTQVSTRAVTGSMPNSTGVLRLGGNNIWPEWFSGRIDEVRVYNRALTATEVQADMTRAVVPGS
jgi:hypothetical protein